jgi:alpha-L-rhamnosidase
VWAGDDYQSARINKYLFADEEIEQRTLIGLVGKEPIEQHINTIIDYSLLWLISLHEHYVFYGNKDFLSRIYPMAQKLMDFCETRINADGFIEQRQRDWTFIDWSDIDKTGAVAAEQMLLIRAYAAMWEIKSALGLDGDDYKEKSVELTRKVNAYYWREDLGAFIDSYASGKEHVTRHANIFAVIYDIATDAQKESILKNVLKNDQITKITTPYFEGYELDALCKLGEFDAVEQMLTSYWGGMINLGATTIWEEFDPSMSGTEHYAMYGGRYEKSLCHAWGAGPIYLFGRYYLGVYPTDVGCSTFAVKPYLGGLDKFSGTAPINGGSVTVDIDRERVTVTATRDGGVLVLGDREYTLPANTPITVKLN